MPAPHKCNHEELLTDLKDKVNVIGTRVLVLLGIISIFVFLVVTTVARVSSAKEQSERAEHRIDGVNARVDVQQERLKWILDGIKRIEAKLGKED